MIMKNFSSRKICICTVFSCLALILGYVESLVGLDFLVPGMKIGISNAVALYLIGKKKPLMGFIINTVRILLSAVLFGSAISFLFSVLAGTASVLVMIALSKVKGIGIIGISIVGSIVHNITQLAVAMLILGFSVISYLPFLLVAATAAGSLTGILTAVLTDKTKNINF